MFADEDYCIYIGLMMNYGILETFICVKCEIGGKLGISMLNAFVLFLYSKYLQ